MFKCSLLATTAFVVAGSLSLLATQSWAHVRSLTVGPGRDRNEEFLCTYGAFKVSDYYHQSSAPTSQSGSGYFSSQWTDVAVPVVGHGQIVDSITVREQASAHAPNSKFTVGLYSSDRQGFPGQFIEGGNGYAPSRCGTVTITIPPTTLQSNHTYWIQENVGLLHGDIGKAFWAKDPKTKRIGYTRFHSAYHHSGVRKHSYTSPWSELAGGPYVRLR